MKAMTKHRSHSAALKRQVAREFIGGETLHGLSKRHDVSRQLIRIWVSKYEAGALDEDAQAAHLLQKYEAKIAALERHLGRQALEITPRGALQISLRFDPVCPGKIDRSPTGTGCSARMAVLSARGLMEEGDICRARSIIGSEFLLPHRATDHDWGHGQQSSPPFLEGPGLAASVSICWTRPIRGPRATDSRTPGRALGRQFERFARFARLS
jgi:transposase-like protein